MGATRTFSDRVITQAITWPAVSVCRADCGMGVGLRVDTRQIVHLHAGGEAQVRLTRPVISRMEEALLHSGRVRVEPSQDWVCVRLDSDADVALLLSLVSVAIKATAGAPAGVSRRVTATCPAARRTHLPRPLRRTSR
jgi:hypothetical protein